MDAAPIVAVADLVFEYPGRRALDGVGFTIAPGTITALVGPNGAGKTTLMRCLAALDVPFTGRLNVCGLDPGVDPRGVHAKIAYLPDEFGLYDALTVSQSLRHAAAMRGFRGAEEARAVARVVDWLGLGDRLEQRAGALSRGWRQRLAIAGAIVHAPDLLILDEPASGLDPEARGAMATLLKQLRAEGMTLLVSSHILSELEDYSTHMLILREGRLIGHEPVGAPRPGDGQEPMVQTLVVRLAVPDSRLAHVVQGRPGVVGIEVDADGRGGRVRFAGVDMAAAALLRALIEAGVQVTAFGPERVSLQDAYLARVAALPPVTPPGARR